MDKATKALSKTSPSRYFAWAWLFACVVWSILLFVMPKFALYISVAVCIGILITAGLVTAQNYGFTAKFVKSNLDLFFTNHSNRIYQFVVDIWHFKFNTTLAQFLRTAVGGLAVVSISVLVFVWRYLESVPSTPSVATTAPQIVVQPVATILVPLPTLTPIPTLPPVNMYSQAANAVVTYTALAPTYVAEVPATPYPDNSSQAIFPTETVSPLEATPTVAHPNYDSLLQSVVPRVAIVEVVTSTGPSLGAYIRLANFGRSVNMTGWRIEDNLANRFEFVHFVLAANALVRIHFVAGQDTKTDLFWRSSYRTNMSGQPSNRWTLTDSEGATVDVY